jgi:hypothetical protein
MKRGVVPTVMLAVVVALLGAALVIFKPELAPTYLYYDLIGRAAAPLPPEVERFVLASGDEYCARGHDSECGGYRVAGGRALVVGPAARASGVAAAWCVDYVTLRRNLGRTRDLIYWAKIPGALVVTRMSGGQFESFPAERCATATLE